VTSPGDLRLPLLVGAAVLLAVGILAAGAWAWLRGRGRRALIARIESVSGAHLRDVLLSDGNDGWFHLDFVLLTAAGLVVLDLRDVPGLVFGSEQMNEWTVIHKQRRATFPNPLGPLYDRLAVVRAIAGKSVPVSGRVVFTDRTTFPKGHPAEVLRLSSLGGELPPPIEATLTALRPAFERVRAASTPSPRALRRS
jgi:hypothetical protein